MDFTNKLSSEKKVRIIQEAVPGKQITMAHIIANPEPIVYKKLGLNPNVDYAKAAIGILTICPSEVSVIAGDLAIKRANIELGFIDRFSGTLIITGKVSEVGTAIAAIIKYTEENLGFTVCDITRT